LVWLVFLSSWICDTFAYLAGVTMGKHQLAPVLSPKKSIEGSIGGVLGSLVLGALFGFLCRMELSGVFRDPVIGCALVSGIGAVLSKIGDLAASAVKRDHGVKDYGTLIPGHGGILDRFDSVIFVSPAIYFLCIWM
jgi:phosphatidate cytidylyltransferase